MYKEKQKYWRPNYDISINEKAMYKPKKLFGSGTRVKILNLFFQGKPETELYGREISRRTGTQINAVRMELKNLEQLGILKARLDYPKILYRINEKSERVENLRGLIL